MQKFIAVCMLWCVGLNRLSAQDIDERNFIHYTRQQGLSHSFISGIVQDSTGYIWISTYRGLNRFDGSSFKTILYTGRPGTLPDNGIYSMLLLPGNTLGLATDGGAQIISAKTLAAHNLDIPTEPAISNWTNGTQYIQLDNDGNYGVSTNTGFYIFSPGGQLKKRLDGYTVKDVGRSWMQFGKHLLQLPNGDILQENSNGLSMYNRRRNTIEKASIAYPALKILDTVQGPPRFFFIGGNDMLYTDVTRNSLVVMNVCTGARKYYPASFNIGEVVGWQTKLSPINDSAWAFNSRTKGFFLLYIDPQTHHISYSSRRYFGDYFCNIIFADRQERLWIGTNRGLFMQNLQQKIIYSAPVTSGRGEDSSVNIISLVSQDNNLFAGLSGKGMLVLNKIPGSAGYTIKADLRYMPFTNAHAAILMHPDTIWLGTDSGLVWLHTKNYTWGRVNASRRIAELSGWPYNVQVFFRDKEGNTWIGANELNKIFCYRAATQSFETIGTRLKDTLLKVNVAESFAEDNKGNIWIGGDAIARWNPRKNRVDTLIQHLPSWLSRKIGFKVLNDEYGDIWTLIATQGIVKLTGEGALQRLDGNSLTWDTYTTRFPSAVYNRILVASESSIGILDMRTHKTIVLGYNDGLPEHPASTLIFHYDSTAGSTWFACGNTICNISEGMLGNKQQPPVFNINELALGNDSIIPYPASYVTLRHCQNNLRISFSAINYTDVQNMKFCYRLLNTNDTDWAGLRSQQVQFNNLNPGVYTLQLRVAALNSQWPDQVKEMTFRIKPPFYRMWWFIVLLVILLLVGVYAIYRWQIGIIRKTERGKAQVQHLKAELAEAQLSALQTQMNPHFIFNALNSIKRMVLDRDTRKASRYLGKFAQMIRLTLSHSKETFVTLRENIEYLEAYLEMEQLRFDDSFSYCIEVDEALCAEEINAPTLMMQPLVENAIWHGLMPKEGEKKITISFIQYDDVVFCSIEDNGIGIRRSERTKGPDQSHRSVGIDNLRNRINILNEKYDAGCTLAITDLQEEHPPGNGTRAVLTFRIIN